MPLTNLASKGTTILMCSESRFTLSHCDLLADYLLLQGVNMHNIHARGKIVDHVLTAFALRKNTELIYDRNI